FLMIFTFETIQEYARRIAEKFHPDKIILYGSYAYGQPTEGSDIDLLVIMHYEGHCLDIAQTMKHVSNLPSLAHLMVKPPEEIEWRYKGFDPLVRTALNRGKVLYERTAAGHC